MVLPIYTFGQPVLRKVAEDITPDYPELKTLIDNMYETLERSEGIGLAAPQIGLSIRLVVINLDLISDDLPEYKGFVHAFINPHILEYDDTETDSMEEGCLSLPGIHEPVRRPTRIRVSYLDEDFQPHDEWVEGYLARVMQHEFDHLDGKMFVDHLSMLRKQMVKGKLGNLLKGNFRCAYKVKTKSNEGEPESISSFLLAFSVSAMAQINTDRMMLMGRNALYYEDYVLSIRRFNMVISAKPYLSEPYFYRGLAKFYLEDYTGAEEDCGAAIDRNPFCPIIIVCAVCAVSI